MSEIHSFDTNNPGVEVVSHTEQRVGKWVAETTEFSVAAEAITVEPDPEEGEQ